MRAASAIKDWQRMYDELKDPEKRDEAKRKTERQKRMEEKRADTGL